MVQHRDLGRVRLNVVQPDRVCAKVHTGQDAHIPGVVTLQPERECQGVTLL